MASICKEIIVAALPEAVWDAVRDVGQVHRRMAPGFVTHSSVEGGERSVTFASGLTVRELIVDIDESARRFSYAVVGGQPTHHNASFQVFPYGEGHSRLVWITDVLPHELAGFIRQTVDQAAPIIARTLATQEVEDLRM
jgi:carbon monoxide dehydrogenase subunit G